jgi:flagellar protein FlaJ
MKKTQVIPAFIGTVIVTLTILFFKKESVDLRNLIIVVTAIAAFVPYLIEYTTRLNRQKEKEQRFLDFVRDIVENVKSGTPINRAIINLKNRDYGVLSRHVGKLASQISIGIPLTIAFETFAKEIDSPVISRSVSLIAEANRSGGEIDTILNSVANSVNQTENLKKERKSAVSNLVVQGYIIFFVFILIVLILEFFLMPLVKDIGPVKDLGMGIMTNTQIDFSQSIFFLLIVQSIFSGLVIGKISEGKLSSGVKHAFILTSLALVISSAGKVIFGGA